MKYEKTIILKDGRTCLLRNTTGKEAEEVLAEFNKTHGESDFLLTYPDEKGFSVEEEGDFLSDKEKSTSEIEICALIDNKIIGLAGISKVGTKEKIKHRAEFGISIEKEYCGIGIGRALTAACIECAGQAGYIQLELDVVADNKKAVALYKSMGFVEYGRNPKGFKSRYSGWQELILMRLELS